MSPALIHALALADQGIPCFPCAANKHPTTKRGLHDATADPERLRQFWCERPGPLIGVPTGKVSGFDVLDVDPKHQTAIEWWTAARPRLPLTRIQRTRSGGLHVFFKHQPGFRNTASKLARGIDTRAEGGYVIWWPAAALDVECDASPAPWPAWLLSALTAKPVPAVRYAVTERLDDRRLAGLVRAVATAGEGARNSILFWATCRVAEAARRGEIQEGFGAAVLEQAAIRAGLSLIEARRTVQSGLRTVTP